MIPNISAPDIDTAIRRLYNRNITIENIAETYKLNIQTVQEIINNNKNKNMKNLNQTKEERDSLIKELSKTGLTHGKIAKTMHCSTSTVARAINGRKSQKKKNAPTPKARTKNIKSTKIETKTRQPQTQKGISILWGAVEWKY
jgi:plasmid maintenance system antidote protein VapI